MRRCSPVIILAVVVSVAAACGDNNKPPTDVPEGPIEVFCRELPSSANTCDVTAGNATTLIKGTVLTPDAVYIGGEVAVDETGHISCAGCDCAVGGETTIACPDAAISPGLINPHDHITFDQNPPYTDTGERYEDRQQWRQGLDQHHDIPAPGSATADQIRWAELRFLMGGATSIVGSGGQAGLLRNLDQANNLGDELKGRKEVEFQTFPLGDSSGKRRIGDCNYGGTPDTPAKASVAAADAYEPHTSEGIDTTARNEFLCETSLTYDMTMPGASNDLLLGKTAMIHAIGLQPSDYGAMAAAGTSLIWSPRSNITLYGETARVTTAARLGVRIALGTDWMPTGSMSLLRELTCADSFNATYLDHYFRDDQLWAMVTVNAAAVTATADVIGVLEAGKVADISIFASHGKKPFRSVIEAQPQDVALVMRGGKVLYGDDAVVGAMAGQSCDTVDVCGTGKRVCTMAEVGKTYSELQTAATPKTTALYPAFACGVPQNEPSCVPSRPVSVAGSTVYTGVPSATDGDGDGIPDASDNCPSTFNPVRPLDGGVQGDADGDGQGDACDPCPLDANTTKCTNVSSSDRDHDVAANESDNCPETWNPDQVDTDNDGKGDTCDLCPAAAVTPGTGCPATIYAIKGGMVVQNATMRLTNVLVTGIGTNGFFVQVKEGDPGYTGPDNSGLFVFTSSAPKTTGTGSVPITVGARVTLDASIANFQGEIELDTVENLAIIAAGPETPPTPIAVSYADIATGGPRAAALEGVLVSVGPATVTATNAMVGEITLSDGASHTLVVDDFVSGPAPLPLAFQGYTAATGILAFRQMASKLEPRSAADLTLGIPGIASLGPAKSFARIGVTNGLATFPQPLTVTLTGPAKGDTTVTISSSDTNLLSVVNIVIPDGATSAPVPVTAVTQATDVTVTATVVTQTLGMQMATSHVQVLGDTQGPTTVTLSPTASIISPNASVVFTATFDIPALVTSTIDLSVNPSNAGTLPVLVTIAPNALSATFTYTDTSANPTATVMASFGGGTPSAATVVVDASVTHLIINEIDYDQPGTDATEFVEIYNPSGSDLPLANKALILVNGGTTPASVYGTIDLGTAPMPTLGSHQYLVLGPAAVLATLPSTVLKIDTGWANAVQNGAPDGVALIDTAAHTLIDALSYEGSITMVTPSGFSSPVSLIEGTVLPATMPDSGALNESLCRSPNGKDTDNAANDWKVCTGITPGAANP